jgi:hypothetical protein
MQLEAALDLGPDASASAEIQNRHVISQQRVDPGEEDDVLVIPGKAASSNLWIEARDRVCRPIP